MRVPGPCVAIRMIIASCSSRSISPDASANLPEMFIVRSPIDFLRDEGLYEEVTSKEGMSNGEMAKRMKIRRPHPPLARESPSDSRTPGSPVRSQPTGPARRVFPHAAGETTQ